MRILILGCKDYPAFSAPHVHSGGMEVYVERLVRSLADRAQFTLYTVGGQSDGAARVEPFAGPGGLRGQPLWLLARSWRRVARDASHFDVLNPHTPLAALAARMAWRRFRVPYVVTAHIFGSSREHAGGRIAAAVYGGIERLVFSEAAAIIPTGQRLAAEIGRRYPGSGAKIHVVTAAGTGVQATAPREVTRRRLGVAEDAPMLFFLGRIIAENGLDETLHAFARLRARHPRAALLIAGTGDRETELGAEVRALGLEHSVRRLGALRGQEKLDCLAAADILVRTSRHEVFPEAYLEALSVGTPVAATPAGDTPDLAEESGAIEILPFADPDGQAERLGELLADPARRARMRDGALAFSSRVTWERQRELYWGVLSRVRKA